LDGVGSSYNDNVFINCPYDPAYARTFEALIFAVTALGFRARAAREIDDGANVRIERIVRIIEDCRYGIHDICRTELDAITGLPRFNMPFELGIFLGAKKYGDDDQRKKATLILDVQQFRYREFISDLAGIDIHAHNGEPIRAIREVRDWLRISSRRQLPSGNVVVELYERFTADLPDIAAKDGHDPNEIPYADFLWIVATWLTNAG